MLETGPGAAIKRLAFQVVNRLRPFEDEVEVSYATDLELDPTAPTGVRKLAKVKQPVATR